MTSKKQQILEYLQTIPKEKVMSYKDLGDIFGVHQRTVAWVMKTNESPEIYPCYKVVAKSRRISGYSALDGVSSKIEKLKKNGIIIKNGIIEEKYFFKQN